MTSGEAAGPCVIVTHRIQADKDGEFIEAIQRLHDERRARGWVTDRWLLLKHRDEPNTYIQIVEYVSPEAETAANESPELGTLRRDIGKASTGYPDHAWTAVARSTC